MHCPPANSCYAMRCFDVLCNATRSFASPSVCAVAAEGRLLGAMMSFHSMMAEVDRLEKIRWEAALLRAKEEAKPAPAMSPETTARAATKLRGRAVRNKRLPAPSIDLQALD